MRALADIARLEESLCAIALGEVARESMPVAGGTAGRGVTGSWVNRAEGLGFHGPVTRVDIARVVAWYEGAGHEAQVKVSPYADASLAAHLGDAGFRLARFESVFFLELGSRPRIPALPPTGIVIRTVDPGDHAAVREVAILVSVGFAPPGAAVNEDELEPMIRGIRRDRAVTLGAYADGRCVAGCGMERHEDLVGLYGLVVAEPYRRRGIQQAMIAARLDLAARRGAAIATIGAAPGIATERNARRFGFQGAYSRAVLIKPRAGA